MATPTLIVGILQALLSAEPSVVSAIHSLLAGTGTADDLAILGADKIAWQSIADKAQAEIAKTPKV
jgi:hypothetical protein